MKLTKYEHACVSVEQDNQLLIIDPGILGELPEDILGVVAIVITHIHPDHLSKKHLRQIVAINPDAKIFTTSEVTEQLEDFTNVIEVLAEDIEKIGPFTLEFFGEEHAVIHASSPVVQNIGVLINESLYYPGDSLTLPEKSVKTLLVPACAPWLKTGEAMDFISNIKPQLVIPTHDGMLSKDGKDFTDMWLAKAADTVLATYTRLDESTPTII